MIFPPFYLYLRWHLYAYSKPLGAWRWVPEGLKSLARCVGGMKRRGALPLPCSCTGLRCGCTALSIKGIKLHTDICALQGPENICIRLEKLREERSEGGENDVAARRLQAECREFVNRCESVWGGDMWAFGAVGVKWKMLVQWRALFGLVYLARFKHQCTSQNQSFPRRYSKYRVWMLVVATRMRSRQWSQCVSGNPKRQEKGKSGKSRNAA